MKKIVLGLVAVAVLGVCMGAYAEKEVTLSRAALLDKIQGGWAGQVIGVVVGGPTEFRAQGETYGKDIAWNAAQIRDVIGQDDLYVEMTFVQVLDTQGLDAPMAAFGKAFGESRYHLWHANFLGRQNIRNGIMPPDSGHPMYNAHADDIDFQIEADFIGLMCPGMPRTSNEYCDRIGHVMNYGDGVYGGMFIDAMYAAAFFESDPEKLVEAGLAAVPEASGFHRAVRAALDLYRKYPADLDAAWKEYEATWGNTDDCPAGALTPFDIDAKTNSAYVALGLLYGGGDLVKSVNMAIRCGQDSDCNGASAGGVVGVIMGYDKMPEDWKSAIDSIRNEKFSFTEYTFPAICESTLRNAEALIAREGGRIEGDQITVRVQDPVPAKLEQWVQDEPVARIGADDNAFQYAGDWNKEGNDRRSCAAGDIATLTFTGTGAMILGPYDRDCGGARFAVDGQELRTASAYLDTKKDGQGARDNESLFHVMGLARGPHTLTITVTGEKGSGAEDACVRIEGAVIFDGRDHTAGDS